MRRHIVRAAAAVGRPAVYTVALGILAVGSLLCIAAPALTAAVSATDRPKKGGAGAPSAAEQDTPAPAVPAQGILVPGIAVPGIAVPVQIQIQFQAVPLQAVPLQALPAQAIPLKARQVQIAPAPVPAKILPANAAPAAQADAPANGQEAEKPPAGAAVEVHRDISYFDGDEAEAAYHRLDVIVPKGKRDFPVVVFMHGGAWLIGDKADFGIYTAVGRMLAAEGIGMVNVNYRLSPKVKHPEHIKDVARAMAWTKKHIAEYGGRPDQLFVSGHSAGGHLSALLASDESYLAAEGLALSDIRGAIPISGVYRIPGKMFVNVFGEDADAREAASPTNHAGKHCPPFLILYGDHDFPLCDIASEEFGKTLRASGVNAKALSIAGRNHIDIILKAARRNDPCAQAMRDFIAAQLQADASAGPARQDPIAQ